MQTGPSSLALNLLAAFLYGGVVWLGKYVFVNHARRNPLYRKTRFLVLMLLWAAINLLWWIAQLPSPWLTLLLTSAVLAMVVFSELNQFWRIGLVGADRHVASGIDYASALKMSKHSFAFLGIGAAKLTQNQKDFRDAIDRCNRATPVRLLLSRPDEEELERFAQMAGKAKDSYQATVRESLRFIAMLKNTEKKNIQVRFYRRVPAFRLMFVDEASCLMSYYVMGKGDGSNLPQLHIIKSPGSQDIDSLYFGFNEYFEKMWNDSTDWDFREFL